MAIINIPTPITTLDNVSFVGSPLHIDATAGFLSVNDVAILELWIWNGGLTDPYTFGYDPTVTLHKSPISSYVTDIPLLFEIGDIINSYINPEMLGDAVSINVGGEGVFYQYQISYKNSAGTPISTVTSSPTKFATGGYNWNYEGQTPFTYNRGSYGFQQANVEKYYSPYINYFDRQINLSGATTSADMVKSVPATYEFQNIVCSPDQYMFVYLNKYGLFDTFTPSGMVSVSSKVNRLTYDRAYNNPLALNPALAHVTNNYNINSVQSYIINTGLLSTDMGMLVEELIMSKKVYLLQFKGDRGNWITADSTLISCDSTLISCDATYDDSDIDNYITFRQIPVVMTDTDFGRKTRLNDKANISYNIKVDEASQKINSIR